MTTAANTSIERKRTVGVVTAFHSSLWHSTQMTILRACNAAKLQLNSVKSCFKDDYCRHRL